MWRRREGKWELRAAGWVVSKGGRAGAAAAGIAAAGHRLEGGVRGSGWQKASTCIAPRGQHSNVILAKALSDRGLKQSYGLSDV